jgi:hypothetical protein
LKRERNQNGRSDQHQRDGEECKHGSASRLSRRFLERSARDPAGIATSPLYIRSGEPDFLAEGGKSSGSIARRLSTGRS